MFEEYHYNPLDPTGPFANWPPRGERDFDEDSEDEYVAMAVKRFVVTMLVLLTVMALMVICGCKAVKPTPTVVEIKDSTATHVHHQVVFLPDTVPVQLPPQTVYVVTPDTASHLETDYAVSDAAIRGGFLHHSLQTKPTPVPVPVQQRVERHDSIVYRDREVPVPYPVVQEVPAELNWWQQSRLYFANAVLVALALAAVWLIVKKRAWWLALLKRLF